MKNIMVSISCLTYNQEKFVADALDSFIMQKVDFDYEIRTRKVQKYVKSIKSVQGANTSRYAKVMTIGLTLITYKLQKKNKFDQLKSSQFKPYYRQLSLAEKLSVLI